MNHEGGRPTPGKVSSVRIGPMNGIAASHAGKVGGKMMGNGMYGEARAPKAAIVATTMKNGMVIKRTSM
jgi:hypothetical protein